MENFIAHPHHHNLRVPRESGLTEPPATGPGLPARHDIPAEYRPGVPAVVLACRSTPHADVNLVRSLGAHQVPVIVISDSLDAPAAASRHCREHLVALDFTRHPAGLRDALLSVRNRHGMAPVVFPACEAGAQALLGIEAELGERVISTLPDPVLARTLIDKERLHWLAEEVYLPTPRTGRVRQAADVEAFCAAGQFPLLIRPSHPGAWNLPGMPAELAQARALRAEDATALRARCAELMCWTLDFLIQADVPGDDDEHYGFHACIDRQGQVRGLFATHSLRLHPTRSGQGCCIESADLPALEFRALSILRRIGHTGLASLSFKRHAGTGEFQLLDISPCLDRSQWLSTHCGVNLPWHAYRDACGWPATPVATRRQHGRHVVESEDLTAFRHYRRTGHWLWSDYLSSVLRPDVIAQHLHWRDPGPLWQALLRRWRPAAQLRPAG